MEIFRAEIKDIPELYRLQLLAFESEAKMIGSRDVPALQESEEENRMDFFNWNTLKMENDYNKIIGAIRYRQNDGFIDVGRLMIHPDYRNRDWLKNYCQRWIGCVRTKQKNYIPAQKV